MPLCARTPLWARRWDKRQVLTVTPKNNSPSAPRALDAENHYRVYSSHARERPHHPDFANRDTEGQRSQVTQPLAKAQGPDSGFAHSPCAQVHVRPPRADRSRGPIIPATAWPPLINPRLTYNVLAKRRAVLVVFYAYFWIGSHCFVICLINGTSRSRVGWGPTLVILLA